MKISEQDMIAFRYYECLQSVIRDLESIDNLTPRETSRHGCLKSGEAAAIIEARKADLLNYIQTVCRDNIFWGKKLLKDGWTPKQAKKRKKK